MRYEPIVREAGAFQQSVTAGQIEAMIGRAFGPSARVSEAVELGGGMFNTTLRVDGDGLPGPVVLRVAPELQVQARSERDLMRAEHAVVPFLAPIAQLLPRILFADFTRQLLPRDYLVQSLLPGVPAPQGLTGWERREWSVFYRQLGQIARTVHEIGGSGGFGRVGGERFSSWSSALLCDLTDIAADLEEAGLEAGDVRQVIARCEARRDVLDQITRPKLLLGDLWVPNVMVDASAPAPVICGVFDTDRAVWGDPWADWTIYQAGLRPGTEVDGFWEAYGAPPAGGEDRWRAAVYAARHLGAIRLERHRMGRADRIAATYDELAAVLEHLAG